MKRGCFISILIVIGLTIGLILLTRNAFDTEYYHEIIPQDLGGELICDVEYNVDIHTGHYSIDYKYFNGKDTIDIGRAHFSSRPWNKNEQLIKFNDFLILKTGCSFDGDMIFIGKSDIDNWISNMILPDAIEKDSVWISNGVISLDNYSPSSSFISKIEDGLIFVEYKYRVDKEISNLIETSQIIYRISKDSGDLKMIDIIVEKRERE
jgi:hypothetical protein